jgi:5-methylcytosine-specific restriction endonuclease McrA
VEILEFQSKTVCSVSTSFQIPSVMRLKRYVNPRKSTRLKFSRENIYLRDNFTCQYCAQPFPAKLLTLDHVVPASKFGKKDWTNVVTACRDCNHKKGNRTPLGAGMPLLNEPRIPNWLPVIQPQFDQEDIPEQWWPYIRAG